MVYWCYDYYEGKHIVLENDIMLNDNLLANQAGAKRWLVIGSWGSFKDGKFLGTFDGRGHTISGMYITYDYWHPVFSGYVGLFGTVKGNGVVKNVHVKDYYINVSGECDYSLYIGGIVGYTTDNATVTGCSFEGKIYGNYNHPYLGGIVGYHNSYKGISDCHASGYLSGTVGQPLNNSSKYLGGIAGYSYSAITACTAAVNTNPGNDYSGYYIGGIVGECRTNVVDCITYGSDANGNPCTVIGYDCENVGGIAGKAASVSLCRNYANVQCINKNMKVGGIVGVCSTVEYSGNFGCVYGTDDNECNGGVNILYVDFILTSTVDNLQGDNSAAIIYATKGAAVIESSVQGIAAVYSTSGALLKQINVAESGRTTIPLAPGFYFVKLGSTTAKIIVR